MINSILLYNSGGGIGDAIQLLPLINTLKLELKNAKFFLYIFIAVLFHYPSLIFLGLIAVNYTKLFSSKRFLIYLVTSIVILAIVYQLLISESIGRQLYHYIGGMPGTGSFLSSARPCKQKYYVIWVARTEAHKGIKALRP